MNEKRIAALESQVQKLLNSNYKRYLPCPKCSKPLIPEGLSDTELNNCGIVNYCSSCGTYIKDYVIANR